MQDEEFYDMMYNLWTKTTWCGEGYWEYADESSTFPVLARNGEGDSTIICDLFRNQYDAEFITAVHGCFGDLIRKLRDLEDENARLDELVDRTTFEKLDLIKEIQSLEDDLGRAYDGLDV